MKRKFIALGLVSVLCMLCAVSLCACTDYEYICSLSVEGGNGTISMAYGDIVCDSDSSPIQFMGSDSCIVVFIATPAEGYRLKRWICDGKETNHTSNVFIYNKLNSHNTKVSMAVEFEPIV